MCGLVGCVFGRKTRAESVIHNITSIFTDLLILSEARGRHATGIAWVNRDDEHRLAKDAVRASRFVCSKAYHETLSSVDDRVTILMGHTRWPTVGDPGDPANAQPIRTDAVIGCHNGTITNADHLFQRLNLPRRAEVDSEVIFRIADTSIQNGKVNITLLSERLSLCRGQMSAVITSWLDPETIVFVKGDRPLEFRYHRKHQVLLYASEGRFLDAVLHGEKGWAKVAISTMSIAVFHCHGLLDCRTQPFHASCLLSNAP